MAKAQTNNLLGSIMSKFTPWKAQERELEEVKRDIHITVRDYGQLSADLQHIADSNNFSRALRYEKEH